MNRIRWRGILALIPALVWSQPFRVGENLHYTAQFNFIPAGWATLQVLEMDTVHQQPTYHVYFQARTGKIADRVYKIRDQIHTWIHYQEYYTHRQQKIIREGSYRKNSTTDIDYQRAIAVTGTDTFRISQPLRDVYSLFYYLRTIPLELDSILQFTAFDNNRETPFRLRISKRETVSVPAGSFTCIKVNPFREKRSLFKNQGDIEIWFSDDETRIPVQIQIHLKYGSMLLQLDSYTL